MKHVHGILSGRVHCGEFRENPPPHHLYVQSQAAAPIPVFASFERLIALCRKCEGHEDAVRVLAVASGRVFSGSYDGTIGVW